MKSLFHSVVTVTALTLAGFVQANAAQQIVSGEILAEKFEIRRAQLCKIADAKGYTNTFENLHCAESAFLTQERTTGHTRKSTDTLLERMGYNSKWPGVSNAQTFLEIQVFDETLHWITAVYKQGESYDLGKAHGVFEDEARFFRNFDRLLIDMNQGKFSDNYEMLEEISNALTGMAYYDVTSALKKGTAKADVADSVETHSLRLGRLMLSSTNSPSSDSKWYYNAKNNRYGRDVLDALLGIASAR